MRIKERNKMTTAQYGAFLLFCMKTVDKAEKCARQINEMLQKELCVVCDKPLHGEDLCHNECYKKIWSYNEST